MDERKSSIEGFIFVEFYLERLLTDQLNEQNRHWEIMVVGYVFEFLDIPCMVFTGVVTGEVCGRDIGDCLGVDTNDLMDIRYVAHGGLRLYVLFACPAQLETLRQVPFQKIF